MQQRYSFNSARANIDRLISELRQFHGQAHIPKTSGHDLLFISDDLIAYTLSILREEEPIVPKLPICDWLKLLNKLQYHGITPLFYLKICNIPDRFHPPEVVVSRMRGTFLLSRAYSIRTEKQLDEILNAINRKSVNTLVIKGPSLAWSVYPDPATRPSADIDLLVKPDKYKSACAVLSNLGYSSPYNRFDVFQPIFNSESFDLHENNKRYAKVDLHWSLFQFHGQERDNNVEELFRRAITIETPFLSFNTLNPIDALVMGAFHMILHHPGTLRLTWVSDIALLASKLTTTSDWDDLIERTSRFKLRLAMEKALKSAQMWFGLRIPEGYDDFTHWPMPEKTEKTELSYLTNKNAADIRLGGYLYTFRKSPNKIRYIFNFLFPPPHYVYATYPPTRKWLLPFSYVRRWAHWIAKLFQYGLHAWQTEHTPK